MSFVITEDRENWLLQYATDLIYRTHVILRSNEIISMFTEKDFIQFREKGIEPKIILQQIEHFKHGFPFLNILNPATVNNGIIKLTEKDVLFYQSEYNHNNKFYRIFKFVPASGAATRMFKSLYEFYGKYHSMDRIPRKILSLKENSAINDFFYKLSSFAFYDDLSGIFKQKKSNLQEAKRKPDYIKILDLFLNENGLNYENLPKGLLKFHLYPDRSRTSLEEHMVEGAEYCCNRKGRVQLHLTVSSGYIQAFEAKVNEVKSYYENKLNVRYNIDFSVQKPSTDTIAVDMENNGFRLEDGSILFRPGGHGALLENINDINADIIFVKNIDNVVPDRLKETTTLYKKALAGVLMKFQERIFRYLKLLGEKEMMEDSLIGELNHFLEKELCVVPPEGYRTWPREETLSYLRKKLNRPIRVCGMVKNEGEPGGGPFWARNIDGTTSLQIVESSQINLDNPQQKLIFDQSTHFNPVDLVCSIKDYQGDKFNLLEFRDPYTGFISFKSKDGRDLKAQELPGLWNGAMSDWNTIFVEVPIITFNPVKTINDLLRKEHQSD